MILLMLYGGREGRLELSHDFFSNVRAHFMHISIYVTADIYDSTTLDTPSVVALLWICHGLSSSILYLRLFLKVGTERKIPFQDSLVEKGVLIQSHMVGFKNLSLALYCSCISDCIYIMPAQLRSGTHSRAEECPVTHFTLTCTMAFPQFRLLRWVCKDELLGLFGTKSWWLSGLQ
ncbi:hypothetical protein Nepgr_025657 [Nepenthes gracilis]|uniref:Uncharacterized protein n=1 Tax=Nepenthes gracilis TaxID=150966 RepID=A0AAD3T6U6_NEPGR|nr:hypothetical protein Nepgr_025657 [Nepenthes gracilis]